MYSGQVCISVQRIIVHQSVYETFKELLLHASATMLSGDPADGAVMNGPLISKTAADGILKRIHQSVDAGAACICGGSYWDAAHNIISPTVLEHVPHESSIWCDEAFGPVACLESYDTFEEALAIANNTRFGLQAGVFSNDFTHIKSAMNVLRAGTVLMNTAPGFRMDYLPYGGLKDSGMGKEGVRSSIEEMTEERVIIW